MLPTTSRLISSTIDTSTRARHRSCCVPIRRRGSLAIVAACQAARVGIVPVGGNTSYCGGATPDASGGEIVLSLARLNRIREVDPLDYRLVADAGCTLHSIQEAAAAAGRLFPLSLGSEGTCQLGGNL